MAKIYDPAVVRKISVRVYKDRFEGDDLKRILEDPKRGLPYIERGSMAYDSLTRSYLRALEIEPTLDRKENTK